MAEEGSVTPSSDSEGEDEEEEEGEKVSIIDDAMTVEKYGEFTPIRLPMQDNEPTPSPTPVADSVTPHTVGTFSVTAGTSPRRKQRCKGTPSARLSPSQGSPGHTKAAEASDHHHCLASPIHHCNSQKKKKGKDKANMNQVVAQIVAMKNFENQLHKWSSHHHLPKWAEQNLEKHLKDEVKRRDEMDKYYKLDCHNICRPWTWTRIWRLRHMHNGDIQFPKHNISTVPRAYSGEDGRPIPCCQSVKEVLSDVDEDEALLTEDLVHEIMMDVDDCSTHQVIEHAGTDAISEWTPINLLKERNHLFTALEVHENTIRSIALVNPKPGDPTPGRTKLNKGKRTVSFGATVTTIVFDKDLALKRGVLSKHTEKLKNYKKQRKREK